jgi:DNA excision repair protein ERCC-8
VLQTADEFEFSSIVYAHHMSAVARQHQLVAVACQSAKVRLIDLKTGSATHCLRGHKEPVYCCQWAPRDEYLLATGG